MLAALLLFLLLLLLLCTTTSSLLLLQLPANRASSSCTGTWHTSLARRAAAALSRTVQRSQWGPCALAGLRQQRRLQALLPLTLPGPRMTLRQLLGLPEGGWTLQQTQLLWGICRLRVLRLAAMRLQRLLPGVAAAATMGCWWATAGS